MKGEEERREGGEGGKKRPAREYHTIVYVRCFGYGGQE